jgi:hypothetical protein
MDASSQSIDGRRYTVPVNNKGTSIRRKTGGKSRSLESGVRSQEKCRNHQLQKQKSFDLEIVADARRELINQREISQKCLKY